MFILLIDGSLDEPKGRRIRIFIEVERLVLERRLRQQSRSRPRRSTSDEPNDASRGDLVDPFPHYAHCGTPAAANQRIDKGAPVETEQERAVATIFGSIYDGRFEAQAQKPP